ncbi:hypothetical protein DVH05_000292 [Phytophthora capsici]|nr:hypothetical protein DVH05_000292 [Phytophthora capsici]
MHFARLDPDAKHALARKYDMSNFSRRYALPKPVVATSVSEVVDAVDVLTAFSSRIFGPLVLNLLQAARTFLLTPRVRSDLSDPAAITALVHYVDERFERFRTRVARKDRVAAASIAAEFSTDHVLYTRLVQAAIQCRITAMVSAATAGYLSGKAPVRGGKERIVRNPGGVPRKPQRTVPLEVLAALPKQNGKALCMRYISKQGCRGQGETCIYEERAHFNPVILPDIVREHIDKNYGGLGQSTPKPENAEA